MVYFKIGSTDFSGYVAEMSVDMEVLLSSESGRNASGNNVVDIVNRKDKVNITTRPLTSTEMSALLTAINSYVVSITFYNPRTNTNKTISAYISTPSPEFYRIIDNKVLYKPLEISFIEM